ncbi:MAG: hypothetical protein ACYCY1_06230 [Sulfuriferula sp.]
MNSLKNWANPCCHRRTEFRRGFGSGVREALIYSAFAVGDSLAADPGERDDFWASTSNKQLNLSSAASASSIRCALVAGLVFGCPVSAGYKEEVIDLLMCVTTVSVGTGRVTQAMRGVAR